MTRTIRFGAVAAALLLVAACGGGDDDTSSDSDDTEQEDGADDESTITAAPDSDADDETSETDDGDTAAEESSGATHEPGDIQMRVVNLLDQPVDIYVRTTGLVEAFDVESGLEPGAVSAFHNPPTEGALIVTTAGAGDATCVATCDHFLAQISAYPEEGDTHTIVLNDADGVPGSFDLWENPGPDRLTNSNSMPAADSSAALVVITSVDVVENNFGMRMAYDGAEGCQESNLDNILVGGNQTPAYAFSDGTVDLVLHDNRDMECVEPSVGGPFTVDGDAGSRTHVFLTGTPGDVEEIILPFFDADAPAESGESAGSSEDRDLALTSMAAQLEAELGLDPEQATCTAEYVVDAVGVDVLVVDGEFVDLDSLPAAAGDSAAEGLILAVDGCGLDPATFGA